MTLEYDPIGIIFEDQSSTPSTPSADRVRLYFKNGSLIYLDDLGVEHIVSASGVTPSTFQARLTLTTAVPITTSDVTAAGTLYLTPLTKGKKISLYTASIWTSYDLTEINISLSGLTTTVPYDIFVYDSSGSPVLETVAWSTNTARATALTTQDGVYVKTGSTNKRYVGTIRMAATSQCEDSVLNRFVWNYYNRVEKSTLVQEATNSWSDTATNWHSWNGSTSNRISMVIGVDEDPVFLEFMSASTGSASGYLGLCLDNTNANDAKLKSISGVTSAVQVVSIYQGNPGIGYHFLQLVAFGAASLVWYGDNNDPAKQQYGAVGHCWC